MSGLRDAAEGGFRPLLEAVRRRIDERLGQIFARKVAGASAHGADTRALTEATRDLTLRGGKRLRPALTVAAHLAVSPRLSIEDEGALLEIGAALELLQTYLLIHDDWMDGDLTRRGGPSVHAMLRAHYEGAAQGEVLLGDAAAILAGDYASALAQESIALAVGQHAAGAADPRAAMRHAVAVLGCFAGIQQDVVMGQVLDMSVRPGDVEAMHTLKTGSYTVRGPLLLGALLGGASEAQLAAIEAFAAPLGVAFQLRDDLLSTFGAEAETGKPRGNDLRAGKRTAVLIEAEKRLDPAGREALGRCLGRPEATADEVDEAARWLERCGARQAVEARLTDLLDRATAGLAGAPLEAAGREALRGAAAALTVRAS
jgi:geranylgeranyl diphosphate synthase type I